MLSVQANELRRRLQESRRKLADSLAQVQQLASHDELTRTLNRRALMARLEEQRSRAERFDEAFCVALLDLDHFKARQRHARPRRGRRGAARLRGARRRRACATATSSAATAARSSC